jgi:hypothetical protein
LRILSGPQPRSRLAAGGVKCRSLSSMKNASEKTVDH